MQLIVKLTNGCNLRCTYCSEGDFTQISMLDKNLLLKIVDDVPELLETIKDDTIDFLWHGGEPLLYPKGTLCEVMEYGLQKLSGKYKVNFLVQTNGTLIDNDWLEIIKKYKIGVGVSLDGYKELHDTNRRTAQGKTTFDTVMNNISLLKENGINVGTLMVLNTTEEIDIDQLYTLIKEYDLNTKIHPVVPCGRAKNSKDTESIFDTYVALMKELYRRSLEEDEPFNIEPLGNILQAILGKDRINECSYSGDCGSKFMCIYVDGTAGFCGRTDAEFSLRYGSLKDMSLVALYRSANAERIRSRQKYLVEHDCKDCSDYEYCHGGCAFEAANSFGTPEHKFMHCAGRKKLLFFLRTEGLMLLKKYLLRHHKIYKQSLQWHKAMLRELTDNESK